MTENNGLNWKNCDPCQQDCSDVRGHCDPCSDELNQYESDIYTSVINWLEVTTCIPWVRALSVASEPNDGTNFSLDQQYGTVYIQSIDDQEMRLTDDIAVGDTERCKRVEYRSIVELNLNVFNFNTCGLAKSPADILSSIEIRYKVMSGLYNELCVNGLAVQGWGIISNIASEESAGIDQRAQRNITLDIKRYTSISEKLIDIINVNLNCCND